MGSSRALYVQGRHGQRGGHLDPKLFRKMKEKKRRKMRNRRRSRQLEHPRCVVPPNGTDIRKTPETEIETRTCRRIAAEAMWIDQSKNPNASRRVVSETYFEVVLELMNQTNSRTEDCRQCSLPTQTQNLQLHQPCSKQSLSRAQVSGLSQTATTISTSMCLDFLALSPGTYKAVLVH